MICFSVFLNSKILEEMKRYNVKPMVQTYMCLLNACAAAGRLDQVYVTAFCDFIVNVDLCRED